MLTLIVILLLIIAWDKVVAVIGGIFYFLILCFLAPIVIISGAIETFFGNPKK